MPPVVSLDELRRQLDATAAQRRTEQQVIDDARHRADSILAAAQRRGAGALTDEETGSLNGLRSEADAARATLRDLDERRDALQQRIADIGQHDQARGAQQRSAERFGGTMPRSSVRVGREAGVYRPDGDHSFFRDLWAMRRDPEAAQRILRHGQQTREEYPEMRAVSTGGLGALVPPWFATEDFAQIARGGRPYANAVRDRPLPPEGMTVEVPLATTGSRVAPQPSENSAVTSQTYAVQDLRVPVVTVAGMVDVSRQSLDRGRDTDRVIFEDIANAYAETLETQVIAGTGTAGTHFGVLSTTDASTFGLTTTLSVSQLAVVGHVAGVLGTNRKRPPTVLLVHPRRWTFWTSAVDGNGRPLIVPEQGGGQAQNAVGTTVGQEGEGRLGTLHSMLVVGSYGVPSTLSSWSGSGSDEDTIVVQRASDVFLYEDMPGPSEMVFEETLSGQLSVRLLGFGYSAFTAGRYPEATLVLSGSGLSEPPEPAQ